MPIAKNQLQKLDRYRWLVPRSAKPGMHTDALIYADEQLLEQILGDLSIEQAINVACLPGIVGRSLAMLRNKKLENPWRKHGNLPL